MTLKHPIDSPPSPLNSISIGRGGVTSSGRKEQTTRSKSVVRMRFSNRVTDVTLMKCSLKDPPLAPLELYPRGIWSRGYWWSLSLLGEYMGANSYRDMVVTLFLVVGTECISNTSTYYGIGDVYWILGLGFLSIWFWESSLITSSYFSPISPTPLCHATSVSCTPHALHYLVMYRRGIKLKRAWISDIFLYNNALKN